MICQFHNGANGFCKLAAFIQFRYFGIGCANRNQQGMLHGIVRNHTAKTLHQKAGTATRNIDVLTNQVAVDPRNEVAQIEVKVLHAVVELSRKIVAEPLRIKA